MFDVVKEPNGDGNAPSHSYGQVVVTPILFMALSLIAVSLRCWVKKGILKNFTLDDWLLVLTELLFVSMCTMVIYMAGQGFGVNSDKLSDHALHHIYLVGYPSIPDCAWRSISRD